ncbi:hypothetical protein C8Q77DRAFT_1082074 [Trametes polyzona]|nr:hypothetical protein C8Q77DRAFT_1082074 [Trametes polyzona]
MARARAGSASSSSDSSEHQTQFIPGSNDDEELYEVEEILAEQGNKYKVKWKGIDRETGKPWEPSWVYKHDCTDVLIREWKEKKEKKKNARRKGGKSTGRRSTAPVKQGQRAASTSTTTTARQTRRDTQEPDPSTSKRSPSHASTSRVPASRVTPIDSLPQKRRTQATDAADEDAPGPSDDYNRPRKKRKVEVEIVLSSPRAPPGDRIAGFSVATEAANGHEDSSDEEMIMKAPRTNGRALAAPSKGKRRIISEPDEDEDEPVSVPLSKVGPPRSAKRRRQSNSLGSTTSGISSSRPGHSATPVDPDRLPNKQSASSKPSSRSRDARSAADGTSSSSRKTQSIPSKSIKKPPSLKAIPQESESDEEEFLSPPFLKALLRARSRSSSALISPETRRVLAQEEEENTQKAANWNPSPSVAVPSPPPQPLDSPASEPGTSLRHKATTSTTPLNSPSRAALQGRPSANDTFSREGIVPETQPIASGNGPNGQITSQPPSRDDSRRPSTPVRASSTREPSASARPASVKAKMKGKGKSTKELRPVPPLSPSVFLPHLPSVDDDDEIEQFSSPEKDVRRAKRALDLPTQDTIESAEFSQEPMDSFVDWNGGAQTEEDLPEEDLFAPREDSPELSLGPDLPPPDVAGPRQAMSAMLDKRPTPAQARPSEREGSPEHSQSQDLPQTTSTQRADAGSQSQLVLHSQIAQLNSALEEKDEQLTQLEEQMEQLQLRIAELEAGKDEDAAAHQAELKALRETSDEKTEQISQLESQLVELQLQLTQQASDADNQRELHALQVRELNESLEERNEQISQLESALVELQTEIADTVAENERLSAAQGQSEEQLAATQARAQTLEDELTDVRGRLAKAEESAAALTTRLKYAEDDRELFKNLYAEASSHAARLAKENEALEARAALAEGQVRDGLAMVRGTFDGQLAKLRAEAERWKALCGVLTAKDERTDDEVRRRAALEPGLREENARLRTETEAVRAEMEEMARTIEQMKAAQRPVEEEKEEEGYADAIADEDVGGDADAEDNVPQSAETSHGVDEASAAGSYPIAPPHAPRDAGKLADRTVFVCQAVVDGFLCHEKFAAPEDVIEHAQKTHYPDLDFSEA